ncbi:putative sulfate exporter family transporter [Pseudolysinimonas kribbensis]|uniref:Membrane protein n=1 Tax=Pseudolysinimonas kribbensis TaxID=433641 RepID=A0ABQ6K3H9_9MICO|nr:putative sulfate exporter family transporter [Pseudolysinimonas kribbensis]GMA94130.1 membrane protein [Pseudolysinimonas kribbensis]
MSAEEAGAPAPSRIAWVPGLLLAGVAAAIGWLVHDLLPWAPWLTVSLVLGVIVGCIPPARRALDGALKAGLALAARRVLRIGIVVLGLQLSLVDIGRLGWAAILLIIALVAVGFVVMYLLGRAFRLPGDEPVLLAAGFSICGVSAVGAMSAARRSDPADGGAPVAMVTLFGTAAIAVLPALALPFGLGHGRIYGDWVGASVHDVGQVVATAGAAGTYALAAAIVVKLTRVLMLAPMVAIASVATRRRMRAAGDDVRGPLPPIVPLFIVGFLALVLIRTFAPVPPVVLDVASTVQSALLATALFGIGASLRLERLVRTGPRALAAGAIGWVVILLLALLVPFVAAH